MHLNLKATIQLNNSQTRQRYSNRNIYILNMNTHLQWIRSFIQKYVQNKLAHTNATLFQMTTTALASTERIKTTATFLFSTTTITTMPNVCVLYISASKFSQQNHHHHRHYTSFSVRLIFSAHLHFSKHTLNI